MQTEISVNLDLHPAPFLLLQEGAPKNPRAIGQAIVEALPSNELISGTPTMAGPGFINIRINPDYISARISNMLKKVPPPPQSPLASLYPSGHLPPCPCYLFY